MTRSRRWTATLCLMLATWLVPLGPAANIARAELVSTRAAMDGGTSAYPRQRIQAFLQREDVRGYLEALGISPAEAQARVAALSDAEIATIEARLDALPAGGSFAGAVLGAILVVLFIVLITDLLGFTDVFPFINPLPQGPRGTSSSR